MNKGLFRFHIISLTVIVALVAFLYLSSNLRAANGTTPVMPLDDAYIHFQYARSFADGYPLNYNPDQPPTSGATSLLYPVILAVGYKFGFTGEQLGWWALAIGIASWLASTWLVYRIAARDGSVAGHWIGLIVATAFALSGSLGWAFMSGMETGLMVLATLLTLWYVIRSDWRGVVIAGTFAALVRPEGAVIGVFAVIYMAVRGRTSPPDPLSANGEGELVGSDSPRPEGEGVASEKRGVRAITVSHIFWHTLPVLAALIQPLINLLATGSATASGLQAKSFLYIVPQNVSVIASDIFSTAARLWSELITGISPDDGMYFVFVLSWLAILALMRGTRRTLTPRLSTGVPSLSGRGESKSTSSPSPFAETGGASAGRDGGEVLILVWLLGLTAMLSLLQTAFWQFKRYQQPMIALFFPLAAWALVALYRLRYRRIAVGVTAVLLAVLVGGSIFTTATFIRYYSENVHEVASSQRPMAAYVATSIPAGTVIGVHDIGVMRYLGNHATYDVIGLTTPGAAKAWQNGPGVAYEQMASSSWRPDYFAIYSDALGLKYFADTDLFKKPPLASFPSTQPERNIASATNGGQAVYKADWTNAAEAKVPWQTSSLYAISNMEPKDNMVDSVNVANLASEDAHNYRWWQDVNRPGFASEVYEQNYVACVGAAENEACRVMDGGRLITGGEEMTINTMPGQDMIWITRVHPRNPVNLAIFVNGSQIGTRIVPPIPGQWLEIDNYVPGNLITSTKTVVRVEANITDPAQGQYMPYYHWFYQGKYRLVTTTSLPPYQATFGQTIALVGRDVQYDADARWIRVDLAWQITGPALLTDVKAFVHLYDPAHLDSQPIAQALDQRPGQGTLPPANWLPGILNDTYEISVPADVKPGTYPIAIGLYDAVTQQRLPVTGEGSDKDRRLFIGEVTVH